jgi:hypothetical protein
MRELSKAQIGAESARAFSEYLVQHGAAEVTRTGDIRLREDPAGHTLPTHHGRLNKSAIADELGIGRSVWSQNPACRQMMADLEAKLGVSSSAAPSGRGTDSRTRELERRINQLEGRNAVLATENTSLRAELRRLGWIEQNALESARLPW